MNNPTTSPSKAKNKALTRVAVLFVILQTDVSFAWCGQDIRIQSGPGQDSVMEVGPDAGRLLPGAPSETIRMESGPDTGSVIEVTPQEQPPAPQDIQTIIVAPQIRVKEQ